MKFSLKSAKLRWIEGKELKEIPIKPPFIESKVWTGAEGSGELGNFEFDPDEKILALTEKGNTQIRILQPWQNQIRPSLDYHHFPVADSFSLIRIKSSLSTGNRIWLGVKSHPGEKGLLLEMMQIHLEEKPRSFSRSTRIRSCSTLLQILTEL